jgi:hypothetical protein
MNPNSWKSIGFFLVIIFLVFFSGCTSTENKQPGESITPIITTSPTSSIKQATPVPTIERTSLTTQSPVVPPLTTEDINLHFIDVAFGGGNVYLERLPYSEKRSTISISNGNPSDEATIQSFISDFNELSQSNKLFENIKDGQADFNIKFIADSGMDAIDTTSDAGWLNREFKCGDKVCAKVKNYDIYINADLEGAQRTHYLLRGLLFSMGFKGESMKYSDSIFFYLPNNNTELSYLDQKAVQIMYGLGMRNGMTVEDVKGKLFFK